MDEIDTEYILGGESYPERKREREKLRWRMGGEKAVNCCMDKGYAIYYVILQPLPATEEYMSFSRQG